MWLGMLAGIAGQLPAIPVEPINWLDSLCLAYIAQIAHWLATPAWSLLSPLRLRWRSPPLSGSDRRDGAAAPCGRPPDRHGAARGREVARGPRLPRSSCRRRWRCSSAPLLLRPHGTRRRPRRPGRPVLDVGQGDSILLDPPAADPVLVDTGPPGAGVAERLRELGVESLAAVVISHDQSDHAGGLAELLESLSVGRLVYGEVDPRLRRLALARGRDPGAAGEGGELDSGALRLTALWPPRELAAHRRRTRTGSASCWWPSGATSRSCSPATPRRRRRRSIRGRSTSSRSPITAPRTPASTPCSTTPRRSSR